ncbi:Acyl-CoA synthetase short-chain family member 3, mitochondrial [Tolypocladium ophioglossoides CBS 100239]|uniref:Acyl-CoA synthetase short-chain family member 3, mitochondrial n=1 Tax=Tolypocladium ophioglossoides (strain CBS 100239) TaxID=1163406 RepID=A0A0L0N2C1_TOLOC|nr:Acyl-CoA synthetase short-chain family member 3, mitochondrial [Tolypocladium ophioglossoides CBS 100239]
MAPNVPARPHLQDEVLLQSLQNPEEIWARQAEHLHWHKKPEATLQLAQRTLQDGVVHPTWEWFSGGEISTCYNCVDRHVAAGNGDRVAIYYDSPVTDTKETYTYDQLLSEVEALAGALREEGVKRGDVVMLYMPMIPAALIGMLAVNRLGAIHSVVFGGFAANALAQRIDACKPVVLLTASCGIVGNRPPIGYRPLVEEAINLSSHKPERTIIWQREQLRWGRKFWYGAMCRWLQRLGRGGRTTSANQSSWQEFVGRAKARGIKADCVPVKSDDPIYIIYTSGTTGTPKGVLRDAGGHAVGLHLSISYIFNIHAGDVAFTASDIGWVVGHSYILYAPLLAGASTVLYEGKPVGTPDASAFWRVVEEYKVNTMFTAPTALRAIKRDDPNNDFLTKVGDRGGLRSLKALFLAGERSEPTLISMYQNLLDKYGAHSSSHVIDNWWSTEAGSPITGRALTPHAAQDRKTSVRNHTPMQIKPGSAGKPMPGFDIRVVDEHGEEVERGSMGNIVLGLPLAPTAFRTLWTEEERFYKSYLKRFDGKLLDTGDAGWIDEEGYVHVMSRSDDVLNVSAYRLSSGAMEQAISSHPLVAECCIVGIPDELKGQLPFAFITLSVTDHPESAVPDTNVSLEIQSLVRKQVGAFASLGGIIQGKGMIPKTRSGKTLRRVLRELVENGVHGEFDKEVAVPSTVEDAAAVEVARTKVKEYFEKSGGKHKAIEAREKS